MDKNLLNASDDNKPTFNERVSFRFLQPSFIFSENQRTESTCSWCLGVSIFFILLLFFLGGGGR